VHPELDPDDALSLLWTEGAHICRLDEPDPIAAWERRLRSLTSVADQLNELGLDSLRLAGPGTDLTIGPLPSSRWSAARFETIDGIIHAPNLPTEEVFVTPDPARVDGVVTATKPLFTSGTSIEGVRVRFRTGQASSSKPTRESRCCVAWPPTTKEPGA
jgi:aminopeptidase